MASGDLSSWIAVVGHVSGLEPFIVDHKKINTERSLLCLDVVVATRLPFVSK